MAKKWIRTIAAIALMWSGVQSMPSAQQPAPSYDVTAAWVASEFPNFGGPMLSGDMTPSRYIFQSMDGCVLQFTQVYSVSLIYGDSQGRPAPYTVTYRIAVRAELAKATVNTFENPNSGGGYDRAVTFSSPTQAFTADTEITTTNGLDMSAYTGLKHLSNFGIQLNRPDQDNVDLLPRVQKAFANTAAICKSQAPPQSNEPF
jgi:hypothetical protein